MLDTVFFREPGVQEEPTTPQYERNKSSLEHKTLGTLHGISNVVQGLMVPWRM